MDSIKKIVTVYPDLICQKEKNTLFWRVNFIPVENPDYISFNNNDGTYPFLMRLPSREFVNIHHKEGGIVTLKRHIVSFRTRRMGIIKSQLENLINEKKIQHNQLSNVKTLSNLLFKCFYCGTERKEDIFYDMEGSNDLINLIVCAACYKEKSVYYVL